MDFQHWQEVGASGDKYPTKNAMLATGAVLVLPQLPSTCAARSDTSTPTATPRWAGRDTARCPKASSRWKSPWTWPPEKLGIDPIELRKMNWHAHGRHRRRVGPAVLRFGHQSPRRASTSAWTWAPSTWDWKNTWQHPSEKTGRIRHGIGVAIFAMGAGRPGPGNSSEAMVKIFPDGSAALVCAVADIGQGQHTVQCQIVAEVLGIPYERVGLVCADTDSTPFATLVSNSCGTWLQGWRHLRGRPGRQEPAAPSGFGKAGRGSPGP